MKENVDYEMTGADGSVTTIKIIKSRTNVVKGGEYLFQYLEGETRKPITPKKDNTFWLPKMYIHLLKFKEI